MSKKLRSAYIDSSAYAVLEELALYRSCVLGERNSRGQILGASTLIDEAVCKYAEEHKSELKRFKEALGLIEIKEKIVNTNDDITEFVVSKKP